MEKFKKLDEAKELLLANYPIDQVYPMMYGFLSVMISDKDAEQILEIVKERYPK